MAGMVDQWMVLKTAVFGLLSAILPLSFTSGQACRYTVRELDFSDFCLRF
jgi:hypothetical protein